MIFKKIITTKDPFWKSAVDLYFETFPAWEREPIEYVEESVNTGNYRCVALLENEQLVGLSLTDVYQDSQYLLLSYLMVNELFRGKQFGKKLCHDVIEYFHSQQCPHPWLLIEAEDHIVDFYFKLGFVKLPFDYLSPHFDDQFSTPMNLLFMPKERGKSPSHEELSSLITHIYTTSYHLPSSDQRLAQQLLQLPKE